MALEPLFEISSPRPVNKEDNNFVNLAVLKLARLASVQAMHHMYVGPLKRDFEKAAAGGSGDDQDELEESQPSSRRVLASLVDSVPDEVLVSILTFLRFDDLLAVMQVSHRFRNVANDPSVLWPVIAKMSWIRRGLLFHHACDKLFNRLLPTPDVRDITAISNADAESLHASVKRIVSALAQARFGFFQIKSVPSGKQLVADEWPFIVMKYYVCLTVMQPQLPGENLIIDENAMEALRNFMINGCGVEFYKVSHVFLADSSSPIAVDSPAFFKYNNSFPYATTGNLERHVYASLMWLKNTLVEPIVRLRELLDADLAQSPALAKLDGRMTYLCDADRLAVSTHLDYSLAPLTDIRSVGQLALTAAFSSLAGMLEHVFDYDHRQQRFELLQALIRLLVERGGANLYDTDGEFGLIPPVYALCMLTTEPLEELNPAERAALASLWQYLAKLLKSQFSACMHLHYACLIHMEIHQTNQLIDKPVNPLEFVWLFSGHDITDKILWTRRLREACANNESDYHYMISHNGTQTLALLFDQYLQKYIEDFELRASVRDEPYRVRKFAGDVFEALAILQTEGVTIPPHDQLPGVASVERMLSEIELHLAKQLVE